MTEQPAPNQVTLPDAGAVADLRTFAVRARRLDPEGAVRLVGHGGVLAVYACALHGAGGPTVLALRTQQVAVPTRCDVTVSVAALLDRLAAVPATGAMPTNGATPMSGATLPSAVVVPIPDLSTPDAAWAGVLPPRGGWSFEGTVAAPSLQAAARAGIEEVAAGTPQAAGAAAVGRLRALVWGRPVPGTAVPAGAAFAAEAFGFVRQVDVDGEPVALHRAGAWWRLSTSRGHVLARTPLL